MDYLSFILPLALILWLCKFFADICRKIGIPEVVGMIFAGILIGLIKYIPGGEEYVLTPSAREGLSFIAELGVIVILFGAGLTTDVKQIKSVGLSASIIAAFGVMFAMGLGFVVAGAFNGFGQEQLCSNLFYGVILTATSVSVTVATLKELGKLNSKVGTTIVSAAILDDIIGVIVLSVVISMNGSGGESPWVTLLKTVLFFVAVFVLVFFAKLAFNKINKRYHHHRRVPIYGFALCLLFAYISEKVFGIADITGAYAVGLALSITPDSQYIDSKADIMSYMLLSPVFFANIGISADFSTVGGQVVLFGICFIVAGIVAKVVGCAISAKICKYPWRESFGIGVGMMPRAEVALVCTNKGISAGVVNSGFSLIVTVLITITSVCTPIFLKLIFGKNKTVAVDALSGKSIDNFAPDTKECLKNGEGNGKIDNDESDNAQIDNDVTNSTDDGKE